MEVISQSLLHFFYTIKNIKKLEKNIMEIKDPTGWTVENNPNKYPYPIDTPNKHHKNNYYDYIEFDKEGKPIRCPCCLLRAKHDNGNCQDNGEYFICRKKKKTIQTKLI